MAVVAGHALHAYSYSASLQEGVELLHYKSVKIRSWPQWRTVTFYPKFLSNEPLFTQSRNKIVLWDSITNVGAKFRLDMPVVTSEYALICRGERKIKK
jgi:hypothetical protein